MSIYSQVVTTDIFIERARAAHGDRYCYRKTKYVRRSDKVTITCHVHGDFLQTPQVHARGLGCAKCGGKHSYTTEEYIAKARDFHGDKYDYSETVYKSGKGHVKIICREHGLFESPAGQHAKGSNCPACLQFTSMSTSEFIKRAVAIHGDRYDYSQVACSTNKAKVKIICQEHGLFNQSPAKHITRKHGCSHCAKVARLDTDAFIERAVAKHGNRFDYSKVRYTLNNEKVVIICADHGDFEQTPSHHLTGNACPQCVFDRNQPTYVYLLTNGSQSKVGISYNPTVRIKQLNRKSPFESTLVAKWVVDNFPSACAIEKQVHERIKHLSAGYAGFDGSTEWFDLPPAATMEEINFVLNRKELTNET